ncbi:MAG: hypothetical protein K5765_00100 [Clostridia bacterium]|nr:hypothetical protein [Clostridia bacterium]
MSKKKELQTQEKIINIETSQVETRNSLEIALDMYLSARQKKSNKEKFIEFSKLSIDGYAIDSFKLGKLYLFGDDETKPNFNLATTYFEDCGKCGNYRGYLALAKIYELGIQTEPNFHYAYYYYIKAYNFGCENVECIAKVGIDSYFGINNKIDYVKAAEFFDYVIKNADEEDRKEKWFSDSAYFLGNIYFDGYFKVKKDYKKSYLAYMTAKNNGCTYKNLDNRLNKCARKIS